jgi:hypothetical protein
MELEVLPMLGASAGCRVQEEAWWGDRFLDLGGGVERCEVLRARVDSAHALRCVGLKLREVFGSGSIASWGTKKDVMSRHFSDIVQINSSKTASQRIHLTPTDL